MAKSIDVDIPMLNLSEFPAAILRDIARNESADILCRKAATRLLIQAGSPLVNIPDLASLVATVKSELTAEAEVIDAVEQAIESPMPEPPPVFKAGFTTKDL